MITRPYILSIAGYDPSGGAGILADIKTFEQHKTIGLAVSTCLTYQTEDSFTGIKWHTENEVLSQLEPLLKRYSVKFVKIGLITLDLLNTVLQILPPETTIIWDPVLSATSGYNFNNFTQDTINSILSRISLITPNLSEFEKLGLVKKSPCNVLLKGGHATSHKNDELLLTSGKTITISGIDFKKPYQKHGTGCVLSSSITANLALGNSLESACILSKAYVEDLLQSNDSLLGYHQK